MAVVIEDEQDKKIKAGEAFHDYDVLAIRNKRPGFKYRWIRSTDRNIARQLSRGWSLVDSNGPEQSVLNPWVGAMRKGTDTDGYIRHNDLILACMPENVFRDRLTRPNLEAIRRQTAATQESFKSTAGALAFEGGDDLPNKMNMKEYEQMLERTGK